MYADVLCRAAYNIEIYGWRRGWGTGNCGLGGCQLTAIGQALGYDEVNDDNVDDIIPADLAEALADELRRRRDKYFTTLAKGGVELLAILMAWSDTYGKAEVLRLLRNTAQRQREAQVVEHPTLRHPNRRSGQLSLEDELPEIDFRRAA